MSTSIAESLSDFSGVYLCVCVCVCVKVKQTRIRMLLLIGFVSTCMFSMCVEFRPDERVNFMCSEGKFVLGAELGT